MARRNGRAAGEQQLSREQREICGLRPDESVQVLAEEDGFGFGGVKAVGAINGGGPMLRVRNTSGRIEIRRRD